MLASEISDKLKDLWILEADENSEKLQLEASPRIVHNEVLRKMCWFGSINEVVRLFKLVAIDQWRIILHDK